MNKYIFPLEELDYSFIYYIDLDTLHTLLQISKFHYNIYHPYRNTIIALYIHHLQDYHYRNRWVNLLMGKLFLDAIYYGKDNVVFILKNSCDVDCIDLIYNADCAMHLYMHDKKARGNDNTIIQLWYTDRWHADITTIITEEFDDVQQMWVPI